MAFLPDFLPTRPPLPYHPCLNHEAHDRVARIHLPVAPRCNLACAYCERNSASPRHLASGPGTSLGIMTVDEAVERSAQFLEEWGAGAIVGIAGPGDPLANAETMEVLRRVRRAHPEVRLCLCTNGLLLPEHVDGLAEVGLESLSVTVNGVTPDVVAAMQPRLVWRGEVLAGTAAAELLLEHQRQGIARSVALGMAVKVNMVVAPGINAHQAVDVARSMAGLRALVFNPMPLIPRAGLSHVPAPDPQFMHKLREACSPYLHVFAKCRQCRADACGVPGKERSQ